MHFTRDFLFTKFKIFLIYLLETLLKKIKNTDLIKIKKSIWAIFFYLNHINLILIFIIAEIALRGES